MTTQLIDIDGNYVNPKMITGVCIDKYGNAYKITICFGKGSLAGDTEFDTKEKCEEYLKKILLKGGLIKDEVIQDKAELKQYVMTDGILKEANNKII